MIDGAGISNSLNCISLIALVYCIYLLPSRDIGSFAYS